MALTISAAAEMVLKVMATHNFPITQEQSAELRKTGFMRIGGSDCRIANVLGGRRFGVLVNLDWFRGSQTTIPKPSLSRALPQTCLDFQLLPTRSKLFALHYLDLYSYSRELEQDRNRWHRQGRWGVKIYPESGEFEWAGGYKRRFHLLHITRPEDLNRI